MKSDSVLKDRDKYIGGSDVPILMGISPFKTRWQLLKEKAEPKGDGYATEFTSPQIEYGNEMEEKIREYINRTMDCDFRPAVKVVDYMRGNCDGLYKDTILEIKTTSIIHDNVDQYKTYLPQILFYMMLFKKENGILAVYERPEDYNKRFKHKRLHIYRINLADYEDLCLEINRQVERFMVDLERMKGNPFLTDEDLQPNDIVSLADNAMVLETQLIALKQVEAQAKLIKAKLKEAMQKAGVKSYISDGGVKVTLVPDGEDTTEWKFNEKAFKEAHEDLYEEFTEPKLKKGRAGYVLITLPKEK